MIINKETSELIRNVTNSDKEFEEEHEKAVDRTIVTTIINLMDSTDWDIDICMDKLKIPSEKRDIYKTAVETELQPAYSLHKICRMFFLQ